MDSDATPPGPEVATPPGPEVATAPGPEVATPREREVVPAPTRREVRPDGVWVEVDGVFLPEVSPELRAAFDHFDAMTKGMTPDEILAILPDLYTDAEGVMRLRRQQIRAVPDLD